MYVINEFGFWFVKNLDKDQFTNRTLNWPHLLYRWNFKSLLKFDKINL